MYGSAARLQEELLGRRYSLRKCIRPLQTGNGRIPHADPRIGLPPVFGGRILNRTLWVIQVLVALVFLVAGGAKLLMPIAEMQKQMPHPLPGWFLRFLGTAEVVGAFGLILPGWLKICPGLAPVAAALLSFITVSATVITLTSMGVAMAILPCVVAILSAFIAYGRWRVVPHPGKGG